jgi:hypothetical protein
VHGAGVAEFDVPAVPADITGREGPIVGESAAAGGGDDEGAVGVGGGDGPGVAVGDVDVVVVVAGDDQVADADALPGAGGGHRVVVDVAAGDDLFADRGVERAGLVVGGHGRRRGVPCPPGCGPPGWLAEVRSSSSVAWTWTWPQNS